MFSSAYYRDLADMCRAGAARARDADHRRQMEKLQREFLELVEGAERQSALAFPQRAQKTKRKPPGAARLGGFRASGKGLGSTGRPA